MPAARLDKGLVGGGGGDHTDGMEARLAKVEAAIEHIQTDIGDIRIDIRDIRGKLDSQFKITWGGIIALGIGLTGVMAKGFGCAR